MENREAVLRYENAAAVLPSPLRKLALSLPEKYQARAEEIRLRAGYPMTVLLRPDRNAHTENHTSNNLGTPAHRNNDTGNYTHDNNGTGKHIPTNTGNHAHGYNDTGNHAHENNGAAVEWVIDSSRTVEPDDLETLCDLAAEFSRYAAVHTIRDGFLPVRGGCRVGLCGSAVMKDGVNTNLTRLSSAVIRIAREQKGIAHSLIPQLFRNGEFANTLLLSSPGGGKTTLLRDMIRELSTGSPDYPPQRVALIDERGEVAVMHMGRAQMDVGAHTDVLDGCPKALGIPMVLRAMNPQIIAVDEITLREDLRAMIMAAGCGVHLLATIHAADVNELAAKPLYRELLAERVFRLTVRITANADGRRYEVGDLWSVPRMIPEMPKAAEIPEVPKVPKVPETVEVPKVAEAAEISKVSKTAEVAEIPKVPEVLNISEPDAETVPEILMETDNAETSDIETSTGITPDGEISDSETSDGEISESETSTGETSESEISTGETSG